MISPYSHPGETDCEAGESVGVGGEREGAFVFVQDFADKHQADAVAVGLGGKEGAEKLIGSFGADAVAIVAYRQSRGRGLGGNPYLAFAVAYAFYRVFNYINQHLFEKHRVEIHRHLTVAKVYFEVYIPANAQALEHHSPAVYSLVEVGMAKYHLGNLDHVGIRCDKAAQGSAALFAYRHEFDKIYIGLRTFADNLRGHRQQRIHSGHGIVDFMGYDTYHLFVALFLGEN